MVTIWIYRLYAIIPQSDASASNAFWTLVAPGGDAEANTYGVPLSANSEEPATNRGVSSAFTAEMLALVKVTEGDLPNLVYYVCDAWTFELLEQRGGTAEVSESLEWQGALDDAGLAVIQPEGEL